MKTEEIIAGNKLIAKFMGLAGSVTYSIPQFAYTDNRSGVWDYRDTFDENELKYNLSWDWLMPVINKLKSETEDPEDLHWLKAIIWRGTIEDVYMAVLEAIINYNDQREEAGI